MPFTFSHPAIVFPVKWLFGRKLSLTGLVMGSVVPDFEKYLKMGPNNAFSHTWHGIFWFNLPLAILLSFVFHGIVKDPLIEHLPEIFRKRLYRYKGGSWLTYFKKHSAVVVVSIIIGAASHILWDDVTHLHGRVVRFYPFLAKMVHFDKVHSYPLYFLLDAASSIGGMLFLAGAVLYLPAARVHSNKILKKLLYWGLLIVLAGLIFASRYSLGLAPGDHWEILFTTISAFLASLVITSFAAGRISFFNTSN